MSHLQWPRSVESGDHLGAGAEWSGRATVREERCWVGRDAAAWRALLPFYRESDLFRDQKGPKDAFDALLGSVMAS